MLAVAVVLVIVVVVVVVVLCVKLIYFIYVCMYVTFTSSLVTEYCMTESHEYLCPSPTC